MIRPPVFTSPMQMLRWCAGRVTDAFVEIERLRRDIVRLQEPLQTNTTAPFALTGGGSSTSCCGRNVPVGIDSFNFTTEIINGVSLSRTSTANNYESATFTLTGGDGTGVYKLVGVEEGDEVASSGLYGMTISLVNVSGYAGYAATYRSNELWVSGGRDTFKLLPDGGTLANGTSVTQNLPDEEFPSSFCGKAEP